MDQPADPAAVDVAGRDFVTTCYEVFLGRDLDTEKVAEERGAWSRARVLRSIFESDEFREVVRNPLTRSLPLPTHLFRQPPSVRQRLWAAYQLPIDADTAAAMRTAHDWRAVLTALLNDERLAQAGGMALVAPPTAAGGGEQTDRDHGPVVLEDPHKLWR